MIKKTDPLRVYKQLREVIKEYKEGFLNIPRNQIEDDIDYAYSKERIGYNEYIALKDYLQG
ncbi:hypothetical protein [Bacillus toyonensis]|uniref:hypothetical protein n=1 Tax=Bacillus toyonensis TaxID=155322 RepID=UPI000BF49B9D|nr:hypothetical protein [Bacillus toyonensis]PGF05153.1 hypothetical protein COM61_01645 [Bacillus toyonensis]